MVRCVLFACLRLRFETSHLSEEQRRLELREAQIEALAVCVVGVEGARGFHHRIIIKQHRAAFAGVEILRCLEAEAAGYAISTHLAIAPFAEMRLAGVFDDRDVALGDSENGVEVDGGSAHVHGQDEFRAIGDGGFHLLRVDLEGAAVTVDEHRQGMLFEDDVEGSTKV